MPLPNIDETFAERSRSNWVFYRTATSALYAALVEAERHGGRVEEHRVAVVLSMSGPLGLSYAGRIFEFDTYLAHNATLHGDRN